MDKLVSIIIPVYNVEEYIEECLNSVVNQTYKNLQVIVIDDGSTDRSACICEKFGKTDSRIEIISQENMGVSAARNKGMSLAKGEFITFIDSDDYVDNDYIETLLKSVQYEKSNKNHYEADMVCCNVPKVKGITNSIVTEKCDMARVFKESGYTWGKLIRRECIKDVFNKEIKYAEDYVFYINLLDNLKIIKVENYFGYHYRIRKGSLSVKDKEETHTMEEFNNKCTFLNARPWEDSITCESSQETKKVIKDHCFYIYTLLMLLGYGLKKAGEMPSKDKLKIIRYNMKRTYGSFIKVTLFHEKNIKRFLFGTMMLLLPGMGTTIANKLLRNM